MALGSKTAMLSIATPESFTASRIGVLAAGLDLTLPEPPLLLTPDRQVSA